MTMNKLWLAFLLLPVLASCGERNKLPGKEDMVVIGDVDWDQLVTPDELNKLTKEEFVERYDGKEITIMLNDAQRSGGYNVEKDQCRISFFWPPYSEALKEGEVEYSAQAYINFFPDYIIQDDLAEEYKDLDVNYSKESEIPYSYCKKKCEWSAESPWACPQQSKYSVLSGRVFLARESSGSKRRYFKMRLKGVAVLKE